MADHVMLTNEEQGFLELTGKLANEFGLIVGQSPLSREQDMAEFVSHLHAIQNMILAQAAARAYPSKYRLLGGNIYGDS
jgi:hypothetical protein